MSVTMMDDLDLIAFIRARLDEDEATARNAAEVLTDGTWRTHDDRQGASGVVIDGLGNIAATGYAIDPGPAVIADHIARHDPARVLREVKAKRSILWRCASRVNEPDQWPNGLVSPRAVLARQNLFDLAAIWNDHPDYRAEWQVWVRL